MSLVGDQDPDMAKEKRKRHNDNLYSLRAYEEIELIQSKIKKNNK